VFPAPALPPIPELPETALPAPTLDPDPVLPVLPVLAPVFPELLVLALPAPEFPPPELPLLPVLPVAPDLFAGFEILVEPPLVTDVNKAMEIPRSTSSAMQMTRTKVWFLDDRRRDLFRVGSGTSAEEGVPFMTRVCGVIPRDPCPGSSSPPGQTDHQMIGRGSRHSASPRSPGNLGT